MQQRPNHNFYDENGSTPLINAIVRNDLAAVQTLIDEGAIVNLPDVVGNYPLHHLLMSERSEQGFAIFKLLVEAGAKLEVVNSFYKTPLHIAASYGRTREILALISLGVDINAKDQTGHTALCDALISQHSGGAAQCLMDNDALIDNLSRGILKQRHLLDDELQQYLVTRRFWNVFSSNEALREALQETQETKFVDGGSSMETVVLLQDMLERFARQDHGHAMLVRNIANILANDQANVDFARCNVGYIHLIQTGYLEHVIPGLLIKTSENTYKLILSDRNIDLAGSKDYTLKSNPIVMIDVHADKLDEALSILKKARELPQEKAVELLNGIAESGDKDAEHFAGLEVHKFRNGRCYFDNHLPLIQLLMALSLGHDQGRLLFKKFLSCMRTRAADEYKQYYSDWGHRVDMEIDRHCKKLIAEKDAAIAAKERQILAENTVDAGFDPVFAEEDAKRPVSVSDLLSDAFKKTFYNTKNTAKSRLVSFLEIPTDKYKYDPVTGKTELKTSTENFSAWFMYFAFGFLLMPIKNTFKLLFEFIPYAIEKLAKHAIHKMTESGVDESVSAKGLASGALLSLLGGVYLLAKIIRVTARLVTSPVTSFRHAWKIHPLLGIASAVLSVALIGTLLFFTLPVTASLAAAVTAKAGLTAASSVYTVINAMMGASVTASVAAAVASFVAIGSAVASVFKGIFSYFGTKDNMTQEVRHRGYETERKNDQLRRLKQELPPLHTRCVEVEPVRSTVGIVRSLDDGAGSAGVVNSNHDDVGAHSNNDPVDAQVSRIHAAFDASDAEVDDVQQALLLSGGTADYIPPKARHQ